MTSVRTYHSGENHFAKSESYLTEVEEGDWEETLEVLKESYSKGDGSLLFPVALGLMNNGLLGVTLEDLDGRTKYGHLSYYDSVPNLIFTSSFFSDCRQYSWCRCR